MTLTLHTSRHRRHPDYFCQNFVSFLHIFQLKYSQLLQIFFQIQFLLIYDMEIVFIYMKYRHCSCQHYTEYDL